MSTQEKVHRLGLKVPYLLPYADGSCILGESDGTPAVVEVDVASDWLSHKPHVLLQLALHSIIRSAGREQTAHSVCSLWQYKVVVTPQILPNRRSRPASFCRDFACGRTIRSGVATSDARRGGDRRKIVRLSRGGTRTCNQNAVGKYRGGLDRPCQHSALRCYCTHRQQAVTVQRLC